MPQQTHPGHTEITALVTAALEETLAQLDTPPAEPVSAETALIGRRSVLDSLGLVTLIVDLEQRIEQEYDVSLTLANERAMSQKSSPFRTVSSLADYIVTLIAEERAVS